MEDGRNEKGSKGGRRWNRAHGFCLWTCDPEQAGKGTEIVDRMGVAESVVTSRRNLEVGSPFARVAPVWVRTAGRGKGPDPTALIPGYGRGVKYAGRSQFDRAI